MSLPRHTILGKFFSSSDVQCLHLQNTDDDDVDDDADKPLATCFHKIVKHVPFTTVSGMLAHTQYVLVIIIAYNLNDLRQET